jgi:putative transposase
MNELPYPSDLTAAQWALIEPLLPAAKLRGRRRKVDQRSITNAIFYVLKGGISWRMLPREFSHWKTVYHYFRLWRLTGLWDRIHDQLRDQVRVSKGRHICPSAAIVDSQSVATQQKGAIGATMPVNTPRVVSGTLWSMYWV